MRGAPRAAPTRIITPRNTPLTIGRPSIPGRERATLGSMAPMGRPLKITTPITAPTEAEPHRRITVADAICEEMEATGLRAELCCRSVGVSRKTIEAWMAEGARACEKHDKGHLLDRNERLRRDFLLNTRLAHARWIKVRLDLHHSIARGELVTGYVIEEIDPTKKEVVDGKERPLVTKRTVRQSRTLPDVKALEWELERLARDEDGERILAARLEVTGAEGGPLEVSTDPAARARSIAAEAEAFVRGLEEQRARDAEAAATLPAGSSNGAEP